MSTSDPDRFDWDRYEHEVGSTGQPAAAGQPDTDPAAAGAGRVLVDSPEAQRPGRGPLREATRRPIVPPWARSRQELAGRTRWAAGLATHYGAYHATRSPKYAGRLVVRAPRGAGRVLRGLVRWLLDLEGEPVRQAVVRREDAEAYRHLSRQRDRRVRWRALVTTALLVALLVAVAVVALAPSWARWAALAILVGVLGILGAPADRPRLLDVAVVIPRAPRLTSEMVSRALAVLGVAGITQALAKDPRAISFPSPITRDGPGWRADVDLPPGVTVDDVADRHPGGQDHVRAPAGTIPGDRGGEADRPGVLGQRLGDARHPQDRQGAADHLAGQPGRSGDHHGDIQQPRPVCGRAEYPQHPHQDGQGRPPRPRRGQRHHRHGDQQGDQQGGGDQRAPADPAVPLPGQVPVGLGVLAAHHRLTDRLTLQVQQPPHQAAQHPRGAPGGADQQPAGVLRRAGGVVGAVVAGQPGRPPGPARQLLAGPRPPRHDRAAGGLPQGAPGRTAGPAW